MQTDPGKETATDQGRLGTTETRLLALESLSEALQSRLRDYEKALVERIADVDDDRRLAAVQLKRALEAQREALEGRVRRRTRWLAAGLILALLLALGASLGLANLTAERPWAEADLRSQADLAALKHEVERLSAVVAQQGRFEVQVTELRDRLAQAAGQLAAVDEKVAQALTAAATAERIARSEEQSRIAGEIERLESVQRDLAVRLEAAQFELASRLDDARPASEEASPHPSAASEPISRSSDAVEHTEALPRVPLAEGEPAALATEAAAEVPLEPSEPAPAAPSLVTQSRVYALQLIGFHDLERFRQFVQEAGLEPPVWYLAETYRRRAWYPVIQGLYLDYDAAQAARDGLSPRLQSLEPWIRPLPPGTELWRLEAAPGASGAGPEVGVPGVDP